MTRQLQLPFVLRRELEVSWLASKAGGTLLAVGLDEKEADELLPCQGEH